MKKILLLFIVCPFYTFSQVGIGTNSPQSILDVQSTNSGIIIPRIALTGPTDTTTISSPIEGMLFYNTSTAGGLIPGLFIWNGTQWVMANTTNISNLGAPVSLPTLDELSDAASNSSDKNLFIGENVGENIITGTGIYNTAMGHESFLSNTMGIGNTAIGFQSLKNNNSGHANTAIGATSLSLNETGNSNVAIGHEAMALITSGSENTAIGSKALGDYGSSVPNNGSNNVAIGFETGLFDNDLSSNNVYIGHKAGRNYLDNTKSGSIFIGHRAGFYESNSNRLYIDNNHDGEASALIYGEFDPNSGFITENKLRFNADVEIQNSLTLGWHSNPSINNWYTFPLARGTAGQILQSDGLGNLFWVNENNIGVEAINDLNDAKTTTNSLYLGDNSGNNSFGGFNIGIGSSSISRTTGNANIAIGYRAGDYITTGTRNVAIGYLSLSGATTSTNITGSDNTAIGNGTLAENISGAGNTSIGAFTLAENSSGNQNTYLGNYAGNRNTIGSSNVGIGVSSNYNNQEGTNNTIIGYGAGEGTALHNKSGSIFMGYQAGRNETTDNKLYITNTDANKTQAIIYGEMDQNFNDGNDNLLRVNGNLEANGNLTIGGLVTDPNSYTMPSSNGTTGQVLHSDADTGVAYWSSVDFSNIGINNLIDGKTITTHDNLYIGDHAGAASGSGEVYAGNIGIGNRSLQYHDASDRNIAIGAEALMGDPAGTHTGGDNIALGHQALNANDESSNNVAIGTGALKSITWTGSNIAIGHNTLGLAEFSSSNVALGDRAGESLYGQFNIAIGANAMKSQLGNTNLTRSNIALGSNSLENINGGENNIALGFQTLRNITNESHNIAIGEFAGTGIDLGAHDNVMVGRSTNQYNRGGNFGTYIGHLAGGLLTGAVQNRNNVIFIGYKAGSIEKKSNTLHISNLESDETQSIIYGEMDQDFTDGNDNLLRVNGKLEVNGTLNATDINFSGLNEYPDDTAAGVAGLVTGDLYQSAGTLKIKL